MSFIRNLLVVAHITWRTGMRDRLYLSLLLALSFALVFALYFGALAYADPGKALLDAGQSAILASGLVLVVFFVASDLRRERDGLLHVLLCECTRSEYVVGKWLGYFALIALLATFGGILLAVGAKLMGAGSVALAQAMAGIAVELAILAAACILFSVVVSSTALVGLYTFAYYVAAHALNDAVRAGEHLAIRTTETWQAGVANLLAWFLPDLSLLDHRLSAAHGIVVASGEFVGGLLYGLLWAAILLVLACAAFRKAEL